jgi:hypothetical protein
LNEQTIDERLKFLIQSTESLHSTAQLQTEQIGKLTTLAEIHEARWEMLRRGLAGALNAALGPDEEEEGGEGR